MCVEWSDENASRMSTARCEAQGTHIRVFIGASWCASNEHALLIAQTCLHFVSIVLIGNCSRYKPNTFVEERARNQLRVE